MVELNHPRSCQTMGRKRVAPLLGTVNDDDRMAGFGQQHCRCCTGAASTDNDDVRRDVLGIYRSGGKHLIDGHDLVLCSSARALNITMNDPGRGYSETMW